jgi:hypothetical protein
MIPNRGLSMLFIGILAAWYIYARFRESKALISQNTSRINSDENDRSSNEAYAEEGFIRTGMYLPQELKELLATAGVDKGPHSPYY